MESFLRFPFSRSFSTRFVTISFRSKDSFLQPVSLDFPGTQVYNRNQSILFQEVLNMNAIIENLLTRRSTRAFLQKEILRAAMSKIKVIDINIIIVRFIKLFILLLWGLLNMTGLF